jgi:hypothetical protein
LAALALVCPVVADTVVPTPPAIPAPPGRFSVGGALIDPTLDHLHCPALRDRRLVCLFFFFFFGVFVFFRLQQIRGMEEGAFFLPNVHECRLNAGEDRLDSSQVYVPDAAAVIGAIYQQLD